MAGVLKVVRGDALLYEVPLNEGEDVSFDSEKVKNREEDEKPTITNLVARIAPAKKAAAESKEPTRDELYARASELDIPGRSEMNKDELAAAIAEAESK
jgi:hypothetical protein